MIYIVPTLRGELMVKLLPEAAKFKVRGLALVLLPLIVAGCGQSSGDRYPDPWVEEPSPGITRVLTSRGVENCSDVVYRPSGASTGPLDPNGEFLVYCRGDGVNSSAWIAYPWLARDRSLVGPLEIYDDIPPPVR